MSAVLAALCFASWRDTSDCLETTRVDDDARCTSHCFMNKVWEINNKADYEQLLDGADESLKVATLFA